MGCEYVGVKGHDGTEAAAPCVCWSEEPGSRTLLLPDLLRASVFPGRAENMSHSPPYTSLPSHQLTQRRTRLCLTSQWQMVAVEACGSLYRRTTLVMKIQVQNSELRVPVNGIDTCPTGILQASRTTLTSVGANVDETTLHLMACARVCSCT